MPELEILGLQKLALSAGVDPQSHFVHEAVRRTRLPDNPQDTEARIAWLVRAGTELGLRVTPTVRNWNSALDLIRQGWTLLTWLEPGPDVLKPGWVLLKEAANGHVWYEGPDGEEGIHSPAKIAKLIGLTQTDEEIEWVIATPALPCENLSHRVHREHNRDHDQLVEQRVGEPHHDHPPHDHHEEHGPGPLWRLLSLMKPETRDIGTVVVFAAFVGFLSLATPLAVEALVTTVAMSMLQQQLLMVSLILLFCLLLAAAINAVNTYVVEVIQRRIFVRVASDLAYRLPRIHQSVFDQNHGPELVNRFFEVLTVQKVSATFLLDGVGIILQTVIGLSVLAFYNIILTGYVGVVVGAMAFLVWVLGRGAVRTSIAESRAKYAVAGCLEELARHPTSFKSAGGSDLALERADDLLRDYLFHRKRHFHIQLRQILFALGFQAFASAALLGLGGWLVIQGQLTLGQLVAAELIVATVAAGFAKIGKHLEGYYDIMASMNKLGHLVDLPLERQHGEAFTHRSKRGAAIRFDNVSFAYDHGHPILNHIDLEIPAGARIGLVGPSGSGKSTLADLLYGLRAPQEGAVIIDDMNLRDIRLEQLRSQVSRVCGPEVIEGTVLENVTLGRDHYSALEVRQALEKVGLSTDVARLPQGLSTPLNANGSPLSQGQVRRLLIARAIISLPRLLILDETLDTLDKEIRRHLVDHLFDQAAPWTLIVISHADDVLRRCDRVINLDDAPSVTRPTPTSNLRTLRVG